VTLGRAVSAQLPAGGGRGGAGFAVRLPCFQHPAADQQSRTAPDRAPPPPTTPSNSMSALVEAPLDVIRDLGQQLTAAATPLPQKYRALFSLRNVQGEEAHKALSAGT